jgi:hypothetical protein
VDSSVNTSDHHPELGPEATLRRSRRRWLFRLLAVGLSLSPLLLLEAGLRWFGYGHDTQLIIPAPAEHPPGTLAFNRNADRAYYGLTDLSGPEPRSFALPKPAGVCRIVVVGGSTVAGFPYASELAFPRHLQIVLQHQAPERQWEVLNAGITAINSFSEVDVVRQALACEPDLLIVHSGHNEFYGPGGLASTAHGISPWLYPCLQSARRQRLFQLGLALLYRPRPAHLLETLPADIAIPLDGPVFARCQAYYETHLRQIVALAIRAQVPLLLTTVPSNLRDQSPMHALARNDLSDREQQEQAQRWKTAARHASYREWDAALAVWQAARRVDPTHALLAYREAQCLEMLGQLRPAAEAYALANDLDGCRLRAPRAFQAAVQRVAAAGSEQVRFCDVATRLGEQSPLPALGEDVFLEHVHYSLEGHWRVAVILGQFIQEQVLRAAWRPERVPEDDRRDALLGVTALDHLAADTFTLMAVQAWPLKLAPDSGLQLERIKARLRQDYAALAPLDRKIFAGLSLDAIQHDLLPSMGQGYRAAGREDLALEMFRRQRQRRPWEASRSDDTAAPRNR